MLRVQKIDKCEVIRNTLQERFWAGAWKRFKMAEEERKQVGSRQRVKRCRSRESSVPSYAWVAWIFITSQHWLTGLKPLPLSCGGKLMMLKCCCQDLWHTAQQINVKWILNIIAKHIKIIWLQSNHLCEKWERICRKVWMRLDNIGHQAVCSESRFNLRGKKEALNKALETRDWQREIFPSVWS